MTSPSKRLEEARSAFAKGDTRASGAGTGAGVTVGSGPDTAENPLAKPGPKASSLAGSYKGEGMTLELKGDPAALTGTVWIDDVKIWRVK